MSYADYDYYKNSYGGSLIPEEKFSFTAARASDRIDEAVYDRLASGVPEEFSEKVKKCCCELADCIYNYADTSAGGSGSSSYGSSSAQSETIGKYSVTYKTSAEQSSDIALMLDGGEAGLEDLLYRIIVRHLGRTGLLYRGVD